MWHQIIYIILLLSLINSFSDGSPPVKYNETNWVRSINLQLSRFRAEHKSQLKLLDFLKEDRREMINGLISAMDIQMKLRTDQECQKRSGFDNESDTKSLKEELQQLRMQIDTLGKSFESLKSQQELQIKLIDVLKELNEERSIPRNCDMAKKSGNMDIIIPNFSRERFRVVCDANTRGGGWTVILRRMDGSVNFTRNWMEYKQGFGDLGGEFFLGLDKIHALTSESKQELLVVLEDFYGKEVFETYDEFAIGNEEEQYVLRKLGKADGTAGDSFSAHRGMKFTTFDRDNDNYHDNENNDDGNCARRGTGAWWYDDCQTCQLTGTYKNNVEDKGVTWDKFRGYDYSLKRAVMMIRTKK